MELVFASNNRHKVDEVQAIAGNDFIIKSLDEISCYDDIPETGNTFEANAGQKSRFIYDRYQLSCFADDSGLEIDSLDGEPGVDSAHYSGSRDFDRNMQLVLQRLGNTPDRTARFRTVISLILDGTEHIFEVRSKEASPKRYPAPRALDTIRSLCPMVIISPSLRWMQLKRTGSVTGQLPFRK